jgi:uncharacterized membrane protein
MSRNRHEKPDRRNVPVKQKELIGEVIRKSVEDIIPADKARQVVERLSPRLTQFVVKTHNGPMPPVEVAVGYEEVLPGSVDRMFRMAEKDQDAFIQANKDVIRRDDRFRIFCVGLGFAALATIIGAATYLAVIGHKEVAIALATLGVSGVIAHFVNAHFSKAKASEEK